MIFAHFKNKIACSSQENLELETAEHCVKINFMRIKWIKHLSPASAITIAQRNFILELQKNIDKENKKIKDSNETTNFEEEMQIE